MENVPRIGYVGPLAPIIGAIVGALITAIVGYFFLAKRKSITFWIAESEDITLPLRRHHRDISFKVGGREFFNLVRSSVFIKNTGNASISSCDFDVEIPGEHERYLAELMASDSELRKSVKITWDEPAIIKDPRFHISVSPFLNLNESFGLLLYIDNKSVNCNVHCRIEDVKVKIKRGNHISMKDVGNVLTEFIAALIGLLLASIIIFIVTWAISKFFPK